MKLDAWMVENRFTNKMFADALATILNIPAFSERTVESWRQGRAMPRRKALAAVKMITEEKVTADDFVDDGDLS